MTPLSNPGDRYDPRVLNGLSDPVRRYFEFALTPGQELVRTAHLQQEGTFATAPGRWIPFQATEYFETNPPRLLWQARMRMASGISCRVRDSYENGSGSMRASVFRFIKIMDEKGTPEMASGSLVRYLAEAAWFPTALLPGPNVRWSGDSVTLTDGPVSATLEIGFGSQGGIESVTATRYRAPHGMTTWAGRFGDYQRVAGMQIPLEGEVSWILPEGPLPYWRGRIVKAEFNSSAGPLARVSERLSTVLG